MKILILEGIATSGKSTVIAGLQHRLTDKQVYVAGEPETHIPIMKRTSELHVEFFEQLIDKLASKSPDLLIFDRLYLTQAFRAGVSLASYASVEGSLADYEAITAFLKVNEDAIADRITKAAGHRDTSWGEYIKTKGENEEEIARYYIEQQRSQLKLSETSKLPFIVCDTTAHDYDKVLDEILAGLGAI